MEKMYSDDNRPAPEELEKMREKLLTELEKSCSEAINLG
jgi:hypothetical protein